MSSSNSTCSWLLFVGTAYCCLRWRANREEKDVELPLSSVISKDEVLRKRRKYCSNSLSISYLNTDPLLILRGQGTRLYDEQNVAYLDTRNNVAHVGHAHIRWVAAVQRQVAILNTNTRYLHPAMCQLAERLLQTFPSPFQEGELPLTKVFFCNSGSEANDLALRLTRAFVRQCDDAVRNSDLKPPNQKRIPIIVAEHAYHGHTLATVDVSPYKYNLSKEYPHSTVDVADGIPQRLYHGDFLVYQVPCPRKGDSTAVVHVQEACRDAVVEYGRVGAMILEGGMSVAGVILPPPGYLRDAISAVRAAGGLYLADEVQTGLGRCGSCFWAFAYRHDVNDRSPNPLPDIVTVGKGFGNGMPLAAVVTNDRVNQALEACGVEYFNTFGGNPVAATAGLAVLDILRDEQLPQQALRVGSFLQTELRKLQATMIPCYIGDVRGSGLFLGIEFVDAEGRPATRITSWLCSHLKEKYRILTSIDGPGNNVMVVKPPMVFSMDDARNFLHSVEQALVQDLPNQAMNFDNDAFTLTPT
jgi:ethanolamine-phosphate phospho-lyase